MKSIAPILVIVAVGSIWLVKRIVDWRRFPAAPGPAIAAYTHYWYLWKVWQGKFEEWNTLQHAQHGESDKQMHHLRT